MVDKNTDNLNKTMNDIKRLLQQMIAIQLYCAGAKQKDIAKNLGLAVGTINGMVKGIKKESLRK